MENGRVPREDSQNQAGIYWRVTVFLFKSVFRTVFLYLRLVGDDRRLRTFNEKYLPASQHQSPTAFRRRMRLVTLGLIVVQIIAVGLTLGGVATSGRGPAVFMERIYRNGVGGGWNLSELLSYWWPAMFLACSAAANILRVNIFYFDIIRMRRSKYAQMMTALKNANLLNVQGVPEPWFYAERALDIWFVGTTSEEVVKRTSLWRESGFSPNPVPCDVGGVNRAIFAAAAEKPNNSTYIYDRYDEWSKLMEDNEKIFNWFLGEYVNQNEFLWKDCFDGFSTAFIGTSGSGKTEAMKCWLTAFLCKQPEARMVICDLKGTADWDVFGPMTEHGKVIKDEKETLLAITSYYGLIKQRQRYMKERGYNNIRTWSEAEGVEVPPIILIIDEFPQITGPLKYDIQSNKEGTPANVLFKMLTMGRSYGIWFALGSQFSGADAIPSQLNKNIKIHVTFRTGSEGESWTWISSGAAFWLGKRKRKPSGEADGEQGYGFVDAEENFVRFWFMHDWFIVHELRKYGVPTAEGVEHFRPNPPKVRKEIAAKIKLYGSVKKLNRWDKKEHLDLKAALETFKKTYEQLDASPHERLSRYKTPLVTPFTPEDDVESYIRRICESLDIEIPSSMNKGGASTSRGRDTFGMGDIMDDFTLPPRNKPDKKKESPSGRVKKPADLPRTPQKTQLNQEDRAFDELLDEKRQGRRSVTRVT